MVGGGVGGGEMKLRDAVSHDPVPDTVRSRSVQSDAVPALQTARSHPGREDSRPLLEVSHLGTWIM